MSISKIYKNGPKDNAWPTSLLHQLDNGLKGMIPLDYGL